jgi:hypothetical protein
MSYAAIFGVCGPKRVFMWTTIDPLQQKRRKSGKSYEKPGKTEEKLRKTVKRLGCSKTIDPLKNNRCNLKKRPKKTAAKPSKKET